MHGGNAVKFWVDLGNERAEMQLFGELARVEIAHRRRLDFEAMRDSLWFAGGNLDLKMGGPAVDITASPFSRRGISAAGRPSGRSW